MTPKILWCGFQEAKLSLEMGLRANLCHGPPPVGREQEGARGKPSPTGPAGKAVLVWCGKEYGEEAEGVTWGQNPGICVCTAGGTLGAEARTSEERAFLTALPGSCCRPWQPQEGLFLTRTLSTPPTS